MMQILIELSPVIVYVALIGSLAYALWFGQRP